MQKRGAFMPFFYPVSIVLLLSLLFIPSMQRSSPFGGTAFAADEDSWEYQNFFRFYPRDVDAVDASSAWVVGNYGAMAKTSDGGLTWTVQEPGVPYDLCAVSAADTAVAWTVGNIPYSNSKGCIILGTSNGGEVWATQYSGEGYELNDIYAVDAMNAWAVGENGTVLTTSDGGATWVSCNCGTASDLNAVCAPSADTAWAVGEGGTIIKSGDKGLTWEAQNSGITSALHGIHSLDSSALWAVGSAGMVLRSNDGGASWIGLSLGSGLDLKDVCSVDGQNIWAAGVDDYPSIPWYPYVGKILKGLEGGDFWMVYETVTAGASEVSASDSDNIWVIGADCEVRKTSDGGLTWSDMWPGTFSNLSGISVVDADTVWVSRAEGNVLKTEDGGSNWVSTDTTGPGISDLEDYLNDVSAVDAENAWAVGNRGKILQTSDGGNTWLSCSTGTTADLYTVEAVNSDTVWAAGASGTILKTRDGNWERQESGVTMYIIDMSAVSPDVAWAVGNDYDTSSGVLLKTENGGLDWQPQDAEITHYIGHICAVDENIVWASVGGYVIKSLDGGESWEIVGNGIYFHEITGLFALDESTAWITSSYSDEFTIIYKTCDGGSSWNPQKEFCCYILDNSIAAADACNAWIVGYHGTILHTSDGGDRGPDIISASPASGGTGAEVTISGCDFGDTQGTSAVYFGDTQAQDYISWSGDRIVVRVPRLVAGDTRVTVATSAGTSNWKTFTVAPLSVQAVAPDQVTQHTFSLAVEITGTGFQPGATVELRRGETIIAANNMQVISDTSITCSCGFFGAEPGIYDVVVTDSGGNETVLAGGFTVVSLCGTGSGTAVMLLGLSLGLLSVTVSLRRRRRTKTASLQ